jgi:MoxR-like ATPase
MARFFCNTCGKIITVEDTHYNPTTDIHKDHNVQWITRPNAQTVQETVAETISIDNVSQRESDVAAIRNVKANLNSVVFERKDAIDVLVLAALCKEHVFMIGPPGTGKNYLTYRFSECVGHRFFEYQINQRTGEDELIGPVNFKALRDEGKQTRIVSGRLLDSEYAFLDEIGNSSSLLRNMLKNVMNERKYDYGEFQQSVPLEMLVAASNSGLNVDDWTESAFEDRFTFKLSIQPLEDPENIFLMLNLINRDVVLPTIDHSVMSRLQKYVNEVEISPEFMRQMVALYMKFVEDAPGGVTRDDWTDRKLFKIMRIACANAVLNGRTKVRKSDLHVLSHIIWRRKEQMNDIQDWVKRNLVSNLDKIEVIANELDDIYASFNQLWDDDANANLEDKVNQAVRTNREIQRVRGRMDAFRHIVEDEEEEAAIRAFDENIKKYSRTIRDKAMDEPADIGTVLEELKKV